MITVSRLTLLHFHRVLRKAGLLKRSKTNTPPGVHFVANPEGLTLQAFGAGVSVSFTISGPHNSDRLIVPLACLADCSQHTAETVRLTFRAGRVMANWIDRGIPVEREYKPVEPDLVPPLAPASTEWSENSPEFMMALRQAMRVTEPGSGRYAFNCIQLAGTAGEVTATDGRQALVQRGFKFPWQEDLLIPATSIFEAAGLPQNVQTRISQSGQYVFLQCGQWTMAFTVPLEGRFPNVPQIIPDPTAITTALKLHPDDVRFLVQRLGQLPLDDSAHQSITVELNGSVVIRSRSAAEAAPIEFRLSRSEYRGDEVRFATDRRYLQHVLKLGFTEIGIPSKQGPVVCRDGQREFVWALLDPQSAIRASEQVHQIDSRIDQAAVIRRHQPTRRGIFSPTSSFSRHGSRPSSQQASC